MNTITISVWEACELAGIDPEARASLAHAEKAGLDGVELFRGAIKHSLFEINESFAGIGETDSLFGEVWTVEKARERALDYAKSAEGLARIARVAGMDLDLDEDVAYKLANCRQIIATIAVLSAPRETTADEEMGGPR
jgi:hypothetical protein